MKFAFALLAFTCFANAEIVTKDFDSKGLSKIKIRNGTGKVDIVAATSGKTVVVADKRKFDDTCKLNMERKEDTLYVEARDTGFVGHTCEVDLKITSPKAVGLDLEVGSGNVQAKGTSGDFAFKVGSGNINVDAEVKTLSGKSGSGDVNISGLTAGGNLMTGSGKVLLKYKIAPATGELDIKSGSGNVEIGMPKTAKIRTSFMAGSGDMTNEIGDSPDSGFKISMKSGSGNLHIKKQ